jgi:ABC-type polysaccharide/polyol phosphate export permease
MFTSSTDSRRIGLRTLWKAGRQDLGRSIMAHRVWSHLGARDIATQYRRTVLGPWWFTLSSVVFAGSLGLVYSRLFGSTVHDFLPYIAAGIFVWQFIAVFITDGANLYLSSAQIILNLPIPLGVHALRLPVRATLTFLHNLLAWFIVALLLQYTISPTVLLVVPMLALVVLALLPISLIIGAVCTRFRDLPVIVTLGVQLFFFITPISWKASQLSGKSQWVVRYNPFVYLIDAVRRPLIGHAPTTHGVLVCVLIAAVGWIVAVPIQGHARRRLVYWL